jgi:hypothetical protein
MLPGSAGVPSTTGFARMVPPDAAVRRLRKFRV